MLTKRTWGSASKPASALTGMVRAMLLTRLSLVLTRPPRRCIRLTCSDSGACLYCTMTLMVWLAAVCGRACAATAARSGANLPAVLRAVFPCSAKAVWAIRSSNSVLRRFPQAALWRSPRPADLRVFLVCSISLTFYIARTSHVRWTGNLLLAGDSDRHVVRVGLGSPNHAGTPDDAEAAGRAAVPHN